MLTCAHNHTITPAGKSSLLNAICGEERSIVCDMSGTTRDAVDTPVTLPSGERLTLIDTAGIRKRARVADSKDGAESISVDRAMRAMGRAEVVVMVIDAAEGVTQQVGCRGGFVLLRCRCFASFSRCLD